MVPVYRAVATFYRLSIVTMPSSAAVWPQFSVECFKLYVANLGNGERYTV